MKLRESSVQDLLLVIILADMNSVVSVNAIQLLNMKEKIVMLPPGNFKRKIYTVENIGGKFNIYVMSSGLDVKRKFLPFYSLVKNGIVQNNIINLVI